jgi:AraC-like DNA-binding protein
MSLSAPFRHALPVSEALFGEALYLTHAGWERITPGAPYPQRDAPLFYFEWNEGRTLPEFCLASVVEGRGEFQTRLHGGPLAAGDAFLFRPGEWHRHRPLDRSGWTLMWIHVNGDAPLRWQREGEFDLRNGLAAVENRPLFQQQFEDLLLRVHRSPGTNSPNFSRLAAGLVAHLLATRPPRPSGRAATVDDPTVRAAVEYIWNFSHDIVDVPTVARKVGLARRTLDRRFRAATGRSVLEEIEFCRISRAAKLLEETSMPVKHVVHRAGFRSDEHLRRAFQKAFGKSPDAFRRRARGPRPRAI